MPLWVKKYVNVYAYISRDHRRWPTNSYRQEETPHRWITPLILHNGLDQWCTPMTERQGGAGKPIKALPSRCTVGVWLHAFSLLGSWRSEDILGCVSPGQEPFDCDLLSIHQDNTDTLKSCMYQKCSPKEVVIGNSIWSIWMTDHGSRNIDTLESSSDTNHLHPTRPLTLVLTIRFTALELTPGSLWLWAVWPSLCLQLFFMVFCRTHQSPMHTPLQCPW